MNGYSHVVLDTNIFLRNLFDPPNSHFRIDTHRLIENLLQKKIKVLVPTVVLSEIYYTSQSFFKISKDKNLENIKRINEYIDVFDENYNTTLAVNLHQEHKSKFIDCLIASLDIFKNPKVVLVSYDTEFDKLGIKRLEPQDIA